MKRVRIKNIEGSELHVDLDDVSLIEMHGQKDSAAGWVKVIMSLRNGASAQVKMRAIDYDELVQMWLPQEAAQ